MNKNYKLGIIGFGGFGKFLYKAWSALDTIEIIAVADLIYQEPNNPSIKIYEQWQELLANDEIDIVSIATPPATHAEIACAAMNAGKHVIIEKPIALNIEDVDKIVATRDKMNVKATVDYMMRFNPIVKILADWKELNPFGELRRVVVENYAQDDSLDSDHWFWDRTVSGGIFIEHGVHFFDMINFISGSVPVDVTGIEIKRDDGRIDRVHANVKYENGLLASFYHSFSRPGFFEHTSIRLVYDLAQIELDGWIPLSGKLSVLVNRNTSQILKQLPGINIIEARKIKDTKDDSRPEGWGEVIFDNLRSEVVSGGVEYSVDEMINATIDIGKQKAELYSKSLRSLMTDFVFSIENSDYQQIVTLENSISSLEVAIQASTVK